MELLRATLSIVEQEPGLEGIYKQVEYPGRICYGSVDRIKEGSAKPFVEGLMRSNHGAPMEHGWVTLKCPEPIMMNYKDNAYSRIWKHHTGKYYRLPYMDYEQEEIECYVSTNLRVLYENGWLNDLQYVCEPNEFHEPRVSVMFTIDRFTGEEFLRHRKGSFNRESTRYINFTKEKFGNGSITFILPPWCPEPEEQIDDDWYRSMCVHVGADVDKDMFTALDYWLFGVYTCEYVYNNLLRLDWQPQQARTILPCAIKSPLMMTAFVSDWVHFFNLRVIGTTGAPHPQAKEVAEPLMNLFIERGLVKIENGRVVMAKKYGE